MAKVSSALVSYLENARCFSGLTGLPTRAYCLDLNRLSMVSGTIVIMGKVMLMEFFPMQLGRLLTLRIIDRKGREGGPQKLTGPSLTMFASLVGSWHCRLAALPLVLERLGLNIRL